MYAISSYRGNSHRPPATNTQTHRQDRLQYTAPLASAQCKKYRLSYVVFNAVIGAVIFLVRCVLQMKSNTDLAVSLTRDLGPHGNLARDDDT